MSVDQIDQWTQEEIQKANHEIANIETEFGHEYIKILARDCERMGMTKAETGWYIRATTKKCPVALRRGEPIHRAECIKIVEQVLGKEYCEWMSLLGTRRMNQE